jgi:hypothetical protein
VEEGGGVRGLMKDGVAISNADYQNRVLRSGRLAIPYTRLVIEILREWRMRSPHL